ncbi:hypothetical protein ACVIGB_000637 [Bradyrhizobium sp. USDA 4341]
MAAAGWGDAGTDGLLNEGAAGFMPDENDDDFDPEEKPPELPLFDQAGPDATARTAIAAIAERCLASKSAPSLPERQDAARTGT